MQLNELIPIKPSCELLLHIQLLGVKLSEFAVELVEPTDQVLEVFSQHPHEEHLHIACTLLWIFHLLVNLNLML